MSQHAPAGEIRVIGASDVRRLLPMQDCIEVIDRVMRAVSRGGALLPLRTVMPLPGGVNMFGVMPGYLDEPAALGAKIVAVYPQNAAQGLSSHNGVIVLLDTVTGRLSAVIDAAEVTAIRTAAATAVATRALARADASTLAMLGAGEQAVSHLEAISLVRPLRRVRVWARSADKARQFAEREGARLRLNVEGVASAREAVAGADIVCTVTASREPILRGDWLAPGMHVNLVGASVPSSREADDEVVRRGRYYVDFRASALAQAGELLHALKAGVVDESHILGEIGNVLSAEVPGRGSDLDITLYKSLGIAAQDLASAQFILERARAESVGTSVPF